MKNELFVNRNIRKRICRMHRAMRRMRQKQHLQRIALYNSFRKADHLYNRFGKMWEVSKMKITSPAEAP